MIDITGMDLVNRLHHDQEMTSYHADREKENKYHFVESIFNSYVDQEYFAAFFIRRAKEKGVTDRVWRIPTPEGNAVRTIDDAFAYMFTAMAQDGVEITENTTYADIHNAVQNGLRVHRYGPGVQREREIRRLTRDELDTIHIQEICVQFVKECLE